VGILTHEYPPFIFGGIGTFAQNLAEGLTRLNVDVTVIAGSSLKQPKRTLTDGKHPVEILWVPRGLLPPRHLWFQLKNVDLIRKELGECDIVHGQDCSAFPMLQLCKRKSPKIPWVMTFHTNPIAELRLALASSMRGGTLTDFATYVVGFPLWDMTIRNHARKADCFVFVSNSLREELLQTYRFDGKSTKVVHTCINVSELQRTISKGVHNRPGNVRIFYSGRFYFRKGVLHLVKIIRHMVDELRIRDFDLQLFGGGPLEHSLRQYIVRHGLEEKITLRGHVKREILLRELAASDIVCMPSLYEACPLAMIEAMAMGKPVVAFDVPYAREMLQDNGMLLASSGLDFAQKLGHLIRSQDDRTRLGRTLRDRVENFNSDTIAMEYRLIYAGLLRDRDSL
jgi:glycosyltransferase involved in cell wall biosynthesis